MKTTKIVPVISLLLVTTLSGCGAYRTSSNIESDGATLVDSRKSVIISADSLPARKYTEIGPIEVSVKKLTIFHKDPTKEQADTALIEKARTIDADAVVNVTYEKGIGMTTWGYIDATWTAVKFTP